MKKQRCVDEFLDGFGVFLQGFGNERSASGNGVLVRIASLVGPENLRVQLERFALAYGEHFRTEPESGPPEWLSEYQKQRGLRK